MSKVQLPVHRGELRTGTISDLTYQGNGVLKVDHYPLFVPDTLPGEQVEVRVTKVTKNFGWGQRTKLLVASPDRVAKANRTYLQTGIAPWEISPTRPSSALNNTKLRSYWRRATWISRCSLPWGWQTQPVIAIRPRSRSAR